MKRGIGRVAASMWCLLKANMMKVRVLLGVLAVLVLVGSATGCGLVSDQTKQDAKNKVESKAQQAKQEVKKKVEAGQEDLQKKVDDLKKKVETGQEDLKKKVDGVQKDINDLRNKVDELLKKVDAQKQQDQKAKK
jgi:peptidoglycan hydrolase CwlO-like protein